MSGCQDVRTILEENIANPFDFKLEVRMMSKNFHELVNLSGQFGYKSVSAFLSGSYRHTVTRRNDRRAAADQ